jgi:hypothetical protein
MIVFPVYEAGRGGSEKSVLNGQYANGGANTGVGTIMVRGRSPAVLAVGISGVLWPGEAVITWSTFRMMV